MFFQTRNRNYDTPPDTNTSGESTSALTVPLTISNIPIEPLPKLAKGPNRQAGNYSKAAHNYSIVYDLAQSLVAMSALEVFPSCPKQNKIVAFCVRCYRPHRYVPNGFLFRQIHPWDSFDGRLSDTSIGPKYHHPPMCN